MSQHETFQVHLSTCNITLFVKRVNAASQLSLWLEGLLLMLGMHWFALCLGAKPMQPFSLICGLRHLYGALGDTYTDVMRQTPAAKSHPFGSSTLQLVPVEHLRNLVATHPAAEGS